MNAGWVVMLAVGLVSGAALAQYRWVDESGQTSYGDYPPAGARDLRRIDPRTADSAATNVTIPFELRRAMEQYPVTLYTSDSCPPCEGARAFLRKRGVPFAERVVDGPDDSAELKRLTGHDKVPVLALGRQTQAGFDPPVWGRVLDAARYPAVSMLPPDYKTEAPQPLIARASGAANKPAAAPASH
jgi:glutaredoxin